MNYSTNLRKRGYVKDPTIAYSSGSIMPSQLGLFGRFTKEVHNSQQVNPNLRPFNEITHQMGLHNQKSF